MRRDGTAWTDGWMETWETVALEGVGGRFPMMPSSSSPLFSFLATFMSREIVASAVDQLRMWLVGAATRLQAMSPLMILRVTMTLMLMMTTMMVVMTMTPLCYGD